MRASWENVARVLADSGPVSDVELAYRLGCARGLIARVRRDLGMAPLPLPLPSAPLTAEDRVMMMAVFVPGGHRRWIGRRTEDGAPIVDNFTTVHRVVFRMTYGREPEGNVRVDCRVKHCVEGSHLMDRLMREERKTLDAAGRVRCPVTATVRESRAGLMTP